MKKRIRFLSFVLILSLAAVGLISAFQLFNLGQKIKMESMPAVELFKIANKIKNNAAETQNAIGQIYLVNTTFEVDDIKLRAESSLIENEKLLLEVNKPEFKIFYKHKLEGEEITLEEYVKKSSLAIKELRNSVENAITLRKGNLGKISELKDYRKNLSKIFRQIKEVKKIPQDKFEYLNRAVLTVLSSDSVKDLAYTGRAVFSEVVDYFKANEKEHKLALTEWAALEKEFNTTLQSAISVYSSNSDFQIFSENLKLFIDNIDKINVISTAALEDAQTILSKDSLKYTYIVAGLSVCSILVCILFSVIIVNRISSRMGEFLASIKGSSGSLSVLSNDLKDFGEKLSSSSEKQSAAMQESGVALDQIESMVQRTNELSQKGVSIAGDASIESENGYNKIKSLADSISLVKSTSAQVEQEVQSTYVELKKIVDVIKNIESKTNVINDIVFQTKLLAFNASVEAARAGESGKGFSVVAEEVGRLAQMSGHSALEISEAIISSSSQVESIIKSSEQRIKSIVMEATQEVEKSASAALESQGLLTKIKASSEEVSNLSSEIQVASTEQAKGTLEISKAVKDFELASQKINLDAQALAGTADSLHTETENLMSISINLDKMVNG